MFDKSLRSLPLVGLNEFRVTTHGVQNLTAKLLISETGTPSSARRIAGSNTSARESFPEPNLSMESSHAAAAPGKKGKLGALREK